MDVHYFVEEKKWGKKSWIWIDFVIKVLHSLEAFTEHLLCAELCSKQALEHLLEAELCSKCWKCSREQDKISWTLMGLHFNAKDK